MQCCYSDGCKNLAYDDVLCPACRSEVALDCDHEDAFLEDERRTLNRRIDEDRARTVRLRSVPASEIPWDEILGEV